MQVKQGTKRTTGALLPAVLSEPKGRKEIVKGVDGWVVQDED